ncbi:MAG: VOC family protein [Chloroflexi bacterium]|nr:VOC family protein [Chloroflexota bacterium]
MAHPVVHFEIAGKDGKKLQEFYGKLFDWKIDVSAEMGDYGLVEASEGGIGGGIFQAQAGMPAYVTIYVSVDDLQAYLDKAASLGGKAIVPPTPIPGVGAFAMFHDPEGNLVGLFKG